MKTVLNSFMLLLLTQIKIRADTNPFGQQKYESDKDRHASGERRSRQNSFLMRNEQRARSGFQVSHMKNLSPNCFTYSSISLPKWFKK